MAITLALHALVFTLATLHLFTLTGKPDRPAGGQKITVLYLLPPAPEKLTPVPEPPALVTDAPAVPRPPIPVLEVRAVAEPVAQRPPASIAAPAPPLYKDDCLPDPPAFSNPFAWDGTSARVQVQAEPPDKLDPQSLADCLKQLPQDSIEAESARDRRLMDQWG